MRYKVNITFSDDTLIFLGAFTLASVLTLLSRLLASEIKSISITLSDDD